MRKKILAFLFVVILVSVVVVNTYLFFLIKTDKTKTIYNNKNVNIVSNDSISEAVNKIYNSVVVVQSSNGTHKISSGTGFIYKSVNNIDYILTNNHVIENSDSFNVILSDGSKKSATLLGKDIYLDLAVLSIEKNFSSTIAIIGNSSDIKIGDTVFTIGSPISDEYSGTVTKGIISAKDRKVPIILNEDVGDYMMKVIQTDASINPGNSGGPLCNINGEVIGITSLKLVQDEIEGMGFAIPINEAMNYVDKLEKGEKIKRPVLGVTLINTSNTYELRLSGISLDSNIYDGVVVENVSENSPASIAGIKKGDIIVKLGKNEIKSRAELKYELYKYNIGENIEIEYYRNGILNNTNVFLNQSFE